MYTDSDDDVPASTSDLWYSVRAHIRRHEACRTTTLRYTHKRVLPSDIGTYLGAVGADIERRLTNANRPATLLMRILLCGKLLTVNSVNVGESLIRQGYSIVKKRGYGVRVTIRVLVRESLYSLLRYESRIVSKNTDRVACKGYNTPYGKLYYVFTSINVVVFATALCRAESLVTDNRFIMIVAVDDRLSPAEKNTIAQMNPVHNIDMFMKLAPIEGSLLTCALLIPTSGLLCRLAMRKLENISDAGFLHEIMMGTTASSVGLAPSTLVSSG